MPKFTGIGSMEVNMNKITTDLAPKAIGPYSQGITIKDLLFTSGQIPINPATGTVDAADIREQAEQSCRNVGEVLKAGGSSFEKVIKTTCFLADMKDFTVFNEVYANYFVSCPARSCVAVKELPKGVLCEIEAVAYR
jgi:2-iminobutanoate/2-iminopropanoate deaminase